MEQELSIHKTVAFSKPIFMKLTYS